jgi:hypothetical protein
MPEMCLLLWVGSHEKKLSQIRIIKLVFQLHYSGEYAEDGFSKGKTRGRENFKRTVILQMSEKKVLMGIMCRITACGAEKRIPGSSYN